MARVKLPIHSHGIANRPFGTGTSETLNRFVNDRDASLTGVQGSDGLIMWPGKDLVIKVVQNTASKDEVGGAKFRLDNEDGNAIWFGESNVSTGLLTIPWLTVEQTVTQPGEQDLLQNVGGATFMKKDENGNVAEVFYVLTQLAANADTVRPWGKWKLTVGTDNKISWEAVQNPNLPMKAAGGNPEDENNRTLNVTPQGNSYLGDTFLLYDDVKPCITFDPNGGRLAGGSDSSTRTETIEFGTTDTQYGIYNKPFGTFGGNDDEIRANAKYLVNDRDLALYGVAKDDNIIYWLDVVCKVTNASNQMLYKYVTVNGTSTKVYASAVYATLDEGMAAVSGKLYRKSGTRYATANTGAVKVKMLRDYTLDESEIIRYTKARDMTLTTAETSITSTMQSNGDTYIFVPAQGAEGTT